MPDDLPSTPDENPDPITFDVFLVDDETDDQTRIGQVEFGPNGMLTVLEATPDQENFLYSTVDTINKKDVMVEKLAPGPDAPRYSVSSRAVARTDKDFLPVLQNYLKTYYGLILG